MTPIDPKYNTEAACIVGGKAKSNALQLQLGTKNSAVSWVCKPVPLDEILRALPPVS